MLHFRVAQVLPSSVSIVWRIPFIFPSYFLTMLIFYLWRYKGNKYGNAYKNYHTSANCKEYQKHLSNDCSPSLSPSHLLSLSRAPVHLIDYPSLSFSGSPWFPGIFLASFTLDSSPRVRRPPSLRWIPLLPSPWVTPADPSTSCVSSLAICSPFPVLVIALPLPSPMTPGSVTLSFSTLF